MGFLSGISNGLSKITSGIGGLLNDATGATSAAKQSQQYALQSAAVNQKYALEAMKENNKYQKEFAQNAYQWAAKDAEKAGLNRVLALGGSASASGGGIANGTASAGNVATSGINPIEAAIGAWNGIEQAQNTGADTNRKNAETANEITKNENIQADTLLKKRQALQILVQNAHTEEDRKKIMAEIRKTDAEIRKIGAETAMTHQNIKKSIGGKTAEYAGTGIMDWLSGN